MQIGGTATGPTFQISAGNDSLAGLRDAINAASGGAVASIVNNGVTDKLVLTSSLTGAANRVQLVEVTVPEHRNRQQFGYNCFISGRQRQTTRSLMRKLQSTVRC
ncbi:MAG: flagellin hook IN motif-containing protein [Pyrinomonadaceae bacterium]